MKPGSPFSLMLRRRVQSRLTQLAQRRITKLGLGLTPGSQQLLDQLILVGVTRLEHQRALEREELILVCEENLLRLITDLLQRCQFLGTFPMADVDSFEAMRKKMCPTWPFC